MIPSDSSPDPFRPGARRVVVLGHPGHELAIYGLLHRHPPDAVVVITDGGSPVRLLESQAGLRRLGLLPRTRYLDFPEGRFYEALLEQDVAFFREVGGAVRAAVTPFAPTDVLVDAVEFYNPVHDITLPVVRLALRGLAAVVWEIPLVYERDDAPGTYAVQRVPADFASRRVTVTLSDEEVAAKAVARDEIYRCLHHQAGPDLLGVSPADMAREELLRAGGAIAAPGDGGRALRYDARGALLHTQRRVARTITHDGHFAPLVDALGVPRQPRW